MIILFMILYSLLAGYFNKSADVTTPAPLHKHKNVTNLRHHNSHILHPKFKHRHQNSGRKYIYNVTGRKLNQHQQKKHHRSHRNKRIPDIPIQSNYVAKQIEACPDTGYFFKQDMGNGLSGSCHLCFCKDNSSAICWPRDNKHCDNEHYEHLAVLKKEQRRRRSPLSFSDIFMRDATKDAIVGRGAEQCKPHEASRSVGCPPDDWCVGCTVCDCSVNGMWDCHLLSFCTEDDKKKKKAQKLLASVRRPDDPYGKQKPKLSSARRREAKEAVQKLAENMAQARQKKKTGKAMAQRRHFFFKNGTLKNSTLFDMRKIVKSKYLNDFNSSQVGEVLALNLKVRKMNDNMTKKRIEAEQENGRKVAQVLNFQVRGMKDKKARRKIKRRHSDAVNVLAKRQPVRKKKQKLIVPPGFELPSDMKNNFVLQTEPSRPATKNLPNKQRNKNPASNKRPVKRASNNQNKRQVKQHFENGMSTKKVPGGTMPNMMKRINEVKNGKRKVIKSKRQTPGTTTSKSISRSIKKPQRRFINSKDSSKTGNGVKEKRGTSKNKTKDKSAYELLLSNLKDTSSNNKSTKSSKAVSKPEVTKKTNHPKVDSKKLNENLMQIQKQMQTQLNSKLLKAVEEMIGETLTEAPAKKVKRAADLILDNIYTNNNQTMVHYKPTGIDIPMVKISVETIGNSTNPLETRVPRQIDLSKLQKQMQENLNRRLIQEVEKMIDRPLTEASIKRQKRFAQLMKKVVKKSVDGKHNETKTLSIPFIKKKHALGASKHVSRRHIALSNLQGYIRSINRKSNKNQWTSPVGTRIKRFALDNNNTETESPIPVLIKPNVEINLETTTPAPTQVGIRQDPARLKRQNIPFSRRNSLQEAAKELLILPTNQVKFNTVKRSASLYKKLVMKKIVSEDRNKSKLVEIPIKKSQRTNVDKSNKIKVRRYKRDSNEELQYDRASLEDFEKSNTMDIIEASSKPMQSLVSTTESSINYYKYSVDEFDKTTPPSGDYVSEIIEVYSKNVAAKRSVDNQINGLTNLTVLKLATNNDDKTSTVRSLKDVNNNSNTTEMNLTKIVAVNNISVVQNAQPEIMEMKTYRTERVLDNQVVIIQEQNMSSVENMTEAFGNSYSSDFVSHPGTLNTMKIKDLINRTVVPIEERNHNKIDNLTEIKDISVKKLITGNKFSSDEFIDRTVVIITDQSTESAITQPNEQSLMGRTTERISKLKFIDSILTTINPSKEPSSVSLPKNIIIQSYENVGKNIAILTEKSVELKETKEDDKTTRNEKNSKNKFTTVGKQATEYKLKTNFNFQNITQNATLVIPLNISSKVTLTPTVKNYLKYRVDKKAFTEKQDLLKRIKQKQAKRKKLQNQAYVLQITTERTDKTIKPKHKIDEHIVFVLQKDIDKKVRENVSAVYNNSFSNAIDTNEIKSNGLDDETMLTVVEQNFTSASYQNIDKSTEKSPVFEYKVKKNVSRLTLPKNKVATYDITKVSLSKKHKLKKVVVTLHNKTGKSESLHSNNVVITQPGHKNGTNDLKSFFKKLLGGFNIKKGNRKGNKARKFKILKYLQKFFKKIFAGDSKHKKNSADDPQLNKRNIIETLCATFGPCNINVKNKAKLQSQINHLNVETYKMLRSVKIIKGLLKLVDFARNDKQIDVVRETTTKTNFKNDVQKLHAILKDTYLDEEQLEKLTDTQKIQLAYIKNNTQDFIQSAGKFTMVLNEIINIITVPDHKSTEVNQKTVFANQEKNENKRKSKLNDSKTIKNKTDTTQSLQKLRELLTRYNMIQNTFMRKIYRAITNIDKGSTENVNKINNTDKVPKESRIIKSNVHNKTEAIQVYTKNIIQNLRKLKNLAQTLNGGSARRKRDLRDDDSIEYLLLLMEYLLKQNHPLDAAPVNDGIDLLIEAIKNAPDIKPIKKKVLQFHARNSSTMDSSEAINSKEDSASDIDVKVSKEANYTNIEDTKHNAVMDHSIEDDEDDDRFAFKRDKTITTEEPTRKFYSKRLDAHDLTTTTPFIDEPSTYSYASSEIITIESTAGTFNSNEIGNGIKFDIYNAEIEEDVAVTDTEKPTTESELTTFTATLETTVDTTKTQEKPGFRLFSNMSALVRSNKNEDVSMSKSRLDWLDESYEEEIKSEIKMSVSTKKPEKGPLMVTKAPKISNDVSGYSKENLEQGLVKKSGTEEVMYKKDMNLLNSLDYGTEKIKTEASESKESESNDKYPGDAFNPYFT